MTNFFGRFGRGIYFTATSSKSHGYNVNSEKTLHGVGHRTMFVAQVTLGKGMKYIADQTQLIAPPQGYHSVLGEVGGALNYDECVVYNNDAALPGYLIVYSGF